MTTGPLELIKTPVFETQITWKHAYQSWFCQEGRTGDGTGTGEVGQFVGTQVSAWRIRCALHLHRWADFRPAEAWEDTGRREYLA